MYSMSRPSLGLVIILAVIVIQINAECCHNCFWNFQPTRQIRVGDFNPCKGNFCGGVGSCNIFCCNCDGGCMTSNGTAPESRIEDQTENRERRNIAYPDEVFQSCDTNEDKKLSFKETVHCVEKMGKSIEELQGETSWFLTMDTNMDGFLSPSELDESLNSS
uniref:EF-hand domain-containing protein n=1 Tax=Acrobeloides nanus TaxID=290746 RepID=A0A914DR36_9BILA